MADQAKPETVQTSAKLEASLSPYERCAFACAVLGALALIFAGWMIWAPLAPAILGAALIYAAVLAARCARAESGAKLPRSVPRRAA